MSDPVDLWVELSTDSARIRTEHGSRQVEFTIPVDQADLSTLTSPLVFKQTAGNAETDFARDIGMRLFGAVFLGAATKLYAWAICAAELQRTGVRLRVVTRSRDLQALPWELLYDRAIAKDFLALIPGYTVLRQTHCETAGEPTATTRPGVLVVGDAEQPVSFLPADTEVMRQNEVPVREDLTEFPHVVHLLPDQATTSTADMFLALSGRPPPRLLILDGCPTDITAAGFAAQVPTVIGFRTSSDSAIRENFMAALYHSLAAGDTAEAAVACARAAVDLAEPGRPDWSFSVLYQGESAAPPICLSTRGRGPSDAGQFPGPSASWPDAEHRELRLDIARRNLETLRLHWPQDTRAGMPEEVLRQLTTLATGPEALEETHPNTSDAPPSRSIASHLAHLSMRAAERTTLTLQLRNLIGPLQRDRLFAVTGEAHLLDAAEKRAKEVQDIIRSARTSPVSPLLDHLAALLDGPLWLCAEAAAPVLKSLLEQQKTLHAQARIDVLSWTARVAELTAALAEASNEGASVIDDRTHVVALESLLLQIKRALDAHQCNRVFVTLNELSARFGRIDQAYMDKHGDPLLAVLQNKLEDAQRLKRRSELIVLRRDRKDDLVQYTSLLRIYGESSPTTLLPGTTVVSTQDRASIVRLIDKVTSAVNDGARGRIRDAGERPQPSTPPATDVAEQLRTIGDLLYSLMIPESTQRMLAADTSGSLTITTDDVEIPWELMHDGEEFLSRRRPFARMPVSHGFPRRVQHQPRDTDGQLKFLLVYADPGKNLSHAKKEVEAIANHLDTTWNAGRSKLIGITTLFGDEATGYALNEALLSGKYHVIHYAGHAQFCPEKPEESRLLLAGGEPFTAHKIQRITRGSPFVFLNACDSSRVATDDDDANTTYLGEEHKGLASAFVYGGASACVGALWPLYDDLAAQFALDFYEKLLGGAIVGEAVRQTREKLLAANQLHIAWAAYALYGNPTTRLPALPVSVRDGAGR
ncbi:CHAT domain-containing protein [Lentzea waywayandensis]|uniref:CHAT domain-containing protein n=1 Tax=Lentzea waywayandensis TaxID=84724 RepID=A0A1I6FDY5_9PSEU|nr:CHAT domain-containing protein [Lentzea waywayandensis]SFR28102.1 CHAT domain-containing protein [Lentzea waywayandensis]